MGVDGCGKRVLAAGMLFVGMVALLIPAVRAGNGESRAAGLFGSVEFRTTLKVLPHWQRVKGLADAQMGRLIAWKAEGRPRPLTQWQAMMARARRQTTMEKLVTVNRFFNRWPYRLDREVYGASDYWATPEEFMIQSGDCEDYGIAKYFTLRQLGLSSAEMRLVVVRDRIRGIGHAVLAVYMGDDIFILDNLTDQVLSHTLYRHYQPQYSVNETHGWAHLISNQMIYSGGENKIKNKSLGIDP